MEETVVPLDLGFRPEQAISAPVLVQTDEACFLTFNAVVPREDGLDQPAGHGVIEFVRCDATRFGYTHDAPCLAADLRTELHDGPYAAVLERIAARSYPD